MRDEQSRTWAVLPPGTALEIVKLRPDGTEATRYPGTVSDIATPAPWLATMAVWTHQLIELDGLRFVRGDHLHEYFSGDDPFNVFAVFSPEGELRGWYANVTHPAWMDLSGALAAVFWHDLYVDVIGLPSGEIQVRDEDELFAAAAEFSDPSLVERILGSRDELLRRFGERAFPFHER